MAYNPRLTASGFDTIGDRRGDVSREREAALGRTLDAVEGELSLAAAGGLQVRASGVAGAGGCEGMVPCSRCRGGGWIRAWRYAGELEA